jgi:hypothetical protein
MIRRISTVFALAALACGGCTSRPHAPALLNESVYQNDDGGFRLEIPAGWVVQARTTLAPNERVVDERKLIGFRLSRADRPAMFEISCMDMPEGANLVTYFTGKAVGPKAWHLTGPIESLMLGSTPSQRLAFISGTGPTAVRKEVTSFRVGARTFFFTLVAAPDDNDSRETVRRVLSQMTWKPS